MNAATPKTTTAKSDTPKSDASKPEAARSRRTAAPRRSISIASDPLDTAAAPAVPPQDAAAEPTTSSRRGGSRRTKSSAPADPPMIDPGLRAGEESWDEETFKLTANIPKSLQRRINGLVIHSQMHGLDGTAPEEINSLTDFVRIAAHEKLRYFEEQLNGGKPFPAPRSLPRGRR